MAKAKKNLELPTVAPGIQWSWDQDVANVTQFWGQSVAFNHIKIFELNKKT